MPLGGRSRLAAPFPRPLGSPIGKPWVALALLHCTPGVRGGPETALPLEPSRLLLGDRAWSWLFLVSPRPSPSPDPEQGWQAQLGPSEAQWAPASKPLSPFPGPEQPQPV